MSKNIRRDDWESLKPTVFGWGINDVNYKTSVREELPRVGGKRKQKRVWTCPYYVDWYSVLRRGFSVTFHKHCPAYIGVMVSEEWKYFSNFIKWVDSQPNKDWQNCELDKDFLGNVCPLKYSPENCVYIEQALNTFISDNKNSRGSLMLGVSPWNKFPSKPFRSQCNNPFTGDRGYIGYFATELEAHKAWQAKKHEYACKLAELQPDLRVAEALCQRYAPDKDWTKR